MADRHAEIPVSVAGLHADFGGAPVLENVSFEIRRGELFGLIGPDGAGKTTTLRLICGLLRPSAGELRVFGRDPWRDREVATHRIGYLSQRFSLYGDLTIDENIEFFSRLHHVHRFAERRNRLLALTGLEPFRNRLADKLSGGMKQKLALACTLVHEPPLVVLDEPTTGVDPVSRREFWKLLGEFLAGGLTIVLATPYLDEAERCSRVALISAGRVLALDQPGQLRQSLGGAMFEVVTSGDRRVRAVLTERLGVARVQSFGDRLHVHVDSANEEPAIRAVLRESGIAGISVRQVTPGLEDVFIDLIARDSARAAHVPIAHAGEHDS